MLVKRIFDLVISFLALIFCLPLIILASLAILVFSGPPVIFSQKRWGKGKKVFTLYKFRTMEIGAEGKKKSLMPYNEADGPVFKIINDPRYTSFGRALAHTGLDELPQLINVLKGDMSLVGPRPLPVSEARRVPKRFSARFSVLPGITSSWIVAGSHDLTFGQWMRLDLEYVRDWDIGEDLKILFRTCVLILKWSCRPILRAFGQ
jgi:lipopolysaccharide/colanic/teichoic acid biosynthesis glycosyltransferase